MKIDLKRDRKDLYQPGSKDFVAVDVPAMTYLAVDGRGDPNTSPAYPTAVAARYAGAYAVKLRLRARTGEDFVVGPLAGLTWNGRHHKIYLSDPRRVAPERMRTVPRQPVRPTD